MRSSLNANTIHSLDKTQSNKLDLRFDLGIDGILALWNSGNTIDTLLEELPQLRRILFQQLVEVHIPNLIGRMEWGTPMVDWDVNYKARYEHWNEKSSHIKVNTDSDGTIDIKQTSSAKIAINSDRDIDWRQALQAATLWVAEGITDSVIFGIEDALRQKWGSETDTSAKSERWRVTEYDFKKVA